MAVGKVGRQQVELRIVRPFDRRFQAVLAVEELFTAALDLGLDPEVKGRRPLGVEIPNQGPGSVPRRQIGEIDGGGGLTHAPFDIVGRENFHDFKALS